MIKTVNIIFLKILTVSRTFDGHFCTKWLHFPHFSHWTLMDSKPHLYMHELYFAFDFHHFKLVCHIRHVNWKPCNLIIIIIDNAIYRPKVGQFSAPSADHVIPYSDCFCFDITPAAVQEWKQWISESTPLHRLYMFLVEAPSATTWTFACWPTSGIRQQTSRYTHISVTEICFEFNLNECVKERIRKTLWARAPPPNQKINSC